MTDLNSTVDVGHTNSNQINKVETLIVDLDGTLCRTDTLHENIFSLISTHPAILGKLILALTKGKGPFKEFVANNSTINADVLPMSDEVINAIIEAKASGKTVALVSASHHKQVSLIATNLGLFDEWFGTGWDGSTNNLSAQAKADFLAARYGAGKFDYIGNASDDLPIWKIANQAIIASENKSVRQAAERANSNFIHIKTLSPRSTLLAKLSALRPHQWSKNLLIFLPLLASHDFSHFGLAAIGFICFCMMASCAYLINDLLDLRADRVHPRKRSRAFASGALQIVDGVFLSTALFVLSVGLSITLAPLQFTFILFFYFVCTLAYSSWLKRKLIIDILVLAGLYTTRIVAGATITSIVLSPWLLVFSMFIFLSLAAVKRQAELTDLAKEQRSKTAGRAYETDDLPVVREIAIAAGFGAVLVFALYISSSDVSQLYSKPELLWLICPLLIYWTTRMVMMTHRGFMDDDPIVFAARDKISFATALLIGLLVFLSI